MEQTWEGGGVGGGVNIEATADLCRLQLARVDGLHESRAARECRIPAHVARAADELTGEDGALRIGGTLCHDLERLDDEGDLAHRFLA